MNTYAQSSLQNVHLSLYCTQYIYTYVHLLINVLFFFHRSLNLVNGLKSPSGDYSKLIMWFWDVTMDDSPTARPHQLRRCRRNTFHTLALALHELDGGHEGNDRRVGTISSSAQSPFQAPKPYYTSETSFPKTWSFKLCNCTHNYQASQRSFNHRTFIIRKRRPESRKLIKKGLHLPSNAVSFLLLTPFRRNLNYLSKFRSSFVTYWKVSISVLVLLWNCRRLIWLQRRDPLVVHSLLSKTMFESKVKFIFMWKHS